MKRHILLILCLACSGLALAQKDWTEKPINWGFKVGVNSMIPDARVKTEYGILNTTSINKVGYQTEGFVRMNVGRLFFQPEFAYCYSSENIQLLTEHNILHTSFDINMHTFDATGIVGYNTVKEGPYILSAFAGCKVKYAYQIDVEPANTGKYTEMHSLYNLYITTGLSTTISHVFFDFRYDIALFNNSVGINNYASISYGEISLNRRSNMLSFSLGFMF